MATLEPVVEVRFELVTVLVRPLTLDCTTRISVVDAPFVAPSFELNAPAGIVFW